MRVHFIAIGGSAMHNLAIALYKKGYKVTGSDDEIFEPAKSRLDAYGLLPEKEGWDVSKLRDIDEVILGMHAKADNPELLKAKELGIKIFSYPEYLYEQSKDKIRIVISGSHGKTTITAMVLHVAKECGIDCDYMVGASLQDYEVMVKLSDSAKYMILEGDEYLSSADDRRPKFHLYKPDIALLSGIAWDHINVFPTFDIYREQFRIFINLISKNGTLIYNSDDEVVKALVTNERQSNNISTLKLLPYSLPGYYIKEGITYVRHKYQDTRHKHQVLDTYALKIFGKHNLSNLNGARLVCNQLGITDKQFYNSITSFKGASKRLEIVSQNANTTIFKDFAHSPSKLKATIDAVKEQFPQRKLVACIELHTYSSLSPEFLPYYNGSMNNADTAIVYFNSHAIQLKGLSAISGNAIKHNFNNNELLVFNDSNQLLKYLLSLDWTNKNLLMMSSGNFDGIDFKLISRLADEQMS